MYNSITDIINESITYINNCIKIYTINYNADNSGGVPLCLWHIIVADDAVSTDKKFCFGGWTSKWQIN